MKKDKREISIVRSSAADYLTVMDATGESDVNAVYCDENVWLTQKMMGLLYNAETHTINYHLKKIFADGEIDENSVIRKFRITAVDGKTYNANHYNLSAIITVGNKVDSPRAEQFEGVLRLSRKEILTNAGSISAKITEHHALSEFEKYRIVQDQLYQSDFDRILLEADSHKKELPEAKNGGE